MCVKNTLYVYEYTNRCVVWLCKSCITNETTSCLYTTQHKGVWVHTSFVVNMYDFQYCYKFLWVIRFNVEYTEEYDRLILNWDALLLAGIYTIISRVVPSQVSSRFTSGRFYKTNKKINICLLYSKYSKQISSL